MYKQVVSLILISLLFSLSFLTFSVNAAETEEVISTGTIINESIENEWLQTDAIITEITRKPGKNNVFLAIATVDYTVPSIGEVSSRVDILKIPFYGSLSSVGDTITVSYQASNPAILYTTIGKIISKYGIYILILLGAVFSVKPIMQAMKRK